MARLNRTILLLAIFMHMSYAWQSVARAEDLASLRKPIRAYQDLVFSEVAGEKVRADIYRPDSDQPAPVCS